jgi:hypothetical protein
MYPAQAFNSIFTIDDLPDEVKVEGIIYTKVGSPYTITAETESFEVYYEGRLLQSPEVQEFIAIANFAPNQWTQGTLLAFTSFDCLITEFSVITDTFEDTYTVATPFSSGTVTRFALCNWAGIDGNGCPLQLLYGGFEGDPETAESGLKWSVSFQKYEEPEGLPAGCTVSYGRLKGGFQNSPVGTYNIVYATEGSEFATVS